MNGSKVDLILKELMERYPVLMPVKEDIFKTYEILRDAFLQDGTLLSSRKRRKLCGQRAYCGGN